MLRIIRSATFDAWLSGLRDRQARARIQARIRRMSLGNPGDWKSVGSGIREMRVDHGPGYRVYYMQHGAVVIVLLCGGDKSTQRADIELAARIAEDWQE